MCPSQEQQQQQQQITPMIPNAEQQRQVRCKRHGSLPDSCWTYASDSKCCTTASGALLKARLKARLLLELYL